MTTWHCLPISFAMWLICIYLICIIFLRRHVIVKLALSNWLHVAFGDQTWMYRNLFRYLVYFPAWSKGVFKNVSNSQKRKFVIIFRRPSPLQPYKRKLRKRWKLVVAKRAFKENSYQRGLGGGGQHPMSYFLPGPSIIGLFLYPCEHRASSHSAGAFVYNCVLLSSRY